MSNSPELLCAVTTPFDEQENLNLAAFESLLTYLRSVGVDAVFVAGTTGEFTALDDDERLTLFRLALSVFEPQRVVAHVGAPSARQAERLARRAVAAGVTRLAAITPYFQPSPRQATIEYYRRIVAAAGGADVYAYLFQARTTTETAPDLLPALSAVGVSGAKISGEDDDAVAAFLAAAPKGFRVWSGNDSSMAWLHRRGGAGVVSGVASAFPEVFVRLRDAIASDDPPAILEAENDARAAVAAVLGGSVAHLKTAVSLQGIDLGRPRTAVTAVTSADMHALTTMTR